MAADCLRANRGAGALPNAALHCVAANSWLQRERTTAATHPPISPPGTTSIVCARQAKPLCASVYVFVGVYDNAVAVRMLCGAWMLVFGVFAHAGARRANSQKQRYFCEQTVRKCGCRRRSVPHWPRTCVGAGGPCGHATLRARALRRCCSETTGCETISLLRILPTASTGRSVGAEGTRQ